MNSYSVSTTARAALIEQIEAGDSPLTSHHSPSAEALESLSRRYGLAPNLALLIHSLSRTEKEFATSVMVALTPDHDTLMLPSQWLIDHASTLAGGACGVELSSAFEAVVDLHRAVLDGRVIERSAWRAARARFTALNQGSDATAAVIGAAAWDPVATPGAFSDVVLGYHDAAQKLWETRNDWTDADDKWAQQVDEAAIQCASSAAGPQKSDDAAWFDSEEGEAWMAVFHDAYEAYRVLHGGRLIERSEGIQKTYQMLLTQGRQSLLESCTRAALGAGY